MCTNIVPHLFNQVMHNHHLVRRVKTPTKLGIICERYWLLNLALTCGQLMRPPLKTSNVELTKILHAWNSRFLCYFGPHDSGHHPTPVDTFHPRRLPPNGLQTPSNIRWRPISGLHQHRKVNDVTNVGYIVNGHALANNVRP